MSVCLIDVRCLQDPPFIERGIGRHARNLLEHARAGLPGVRLVGLTDAALPALSDGVRGLLDAVRVSAYTGAIGAPACFVQLSPMTHDALFTARLLHHPDIACATVVYDFIPFDLPERYLPSPALRLDYHLALRWLARYALFLPISSDAAGRLRDLLGVADHRIAVTGAPLAASFERLPRGPGRHALVIAGPDPRKNPECAVRAHAATRWMQAGRVPLVITGTYPPEWVASMQAMAGVLGGDPALVQATGHVDEGVLHGLYAGAVCVITPSRAEGFSLPVVEAMAAGVPVVASDIPAHRELLSEALFPADDDGALRALLERVREPAWCAAALARQAAVWPRFRAEAVAGRFWAAVARLVPGGAPSVPLARARVALLTPLPPDQSGVADYSAATCVELGKRVELHVFTPTAKPQAVAGAVSVQALSALPLLSSRFDRVVGVLGNSTYHLEILRLLLRFGGAAILHDGRMLDLYAGHIGFEKAVCLAEAETGRRLRPNEMWEWLAGDRPPEALLLAEVAAAAEPLMMHAPAGVAEVGRRYGVAAVRLPFCLQRVIPEAGLTDAARRAARGRLGVGADQVLLASFGFLHPSKAPVDCLWSLSLLRSWGVDARLAFVGATMMDTGPLRDLAEGLGLTPFVSLGEAFVREEAYRDYLAGADIAIQLRVTGPGSMSGTLTDCIAAGLGTVASVGLMDGMDAPDYVRPVPDNPSPILVAEAALSLWSGRPTAAARGGRPTAAARQAYVATHGFDRYARELCAALGLE